MKLVLRKIVDMLSEHIKDIDPLPESDIRLFVQEKNIPLHEDHVWFLMRFGGKIDNRPRIFQWYGGDFDFYCFKRVCVENCPDMRTPEGNVFFGRTFAGDALCVDCKSGKIYAYDEGDRYGLVHESIDGFVLRCLVSVYDDESFSSKVVALDVELDLLNRFRVGNEKNKIIAANAFSVEYANIDSPVAIAEYYWVDNKLIALYPTTQSMVTYCGGILENISS